VNCVVVEEIISIEQCQASVMCNSKHCFCCFFHLCQEVLLSGEFVLFVLSRKIQDCFS